MLKSRAINATATRVLQSFWKRCLAIPTCSQPLGVALPTDEHACSVSLPTWSSVVGYEEGHAHVTNALSTGYPRFVYHPYVVQLMQAVVERHGNPATEDCLLLPTLGAALRCQAFLQQSLLRMQTKDNALIREPSDETVDSNRSIRHVSATENVHAVIFPAQTAAGVSAKAYWQHTGEIVSSRRAEAALEALDLPIQRYVTSCQSVAHPACAKKISDTTSHNPEVSQKLLKRRIANDWIDNGSVTENEVFLVSSGMAAIYGALRSARRYHQSQQSDLKQGGKSIVYGFPYLDTLKMCSRPELSPAGVEFFGKGDRTDLEQLERVLSQSNAKSFSVLFTEVPSNPLLQCPDLVRLRELADRHNFCLVVDDTIANFLNINVFDYADAVCSSLTKLVSGRGDAIAGSIVTNPQTERGRWMQSDLMANEEEGAVWGPDVSAVLTNSTDFVERNETINATAISLATWLREQPDVATVYYPPFNADDKMTPLLRPGMGYGGVVSLVLHPHVCQRSFFDALNVAKGPSLGTNFTLVCPYTLLAHYHELDFAMSYQVPPNLLRVAVGLEPFDELQEKFASALDTSRLYPKLVMADMKDSTADPKQ